MKIKSKNKIIIIGVLSMLSLCLVPTVHAKYTTKGMASDIARVAKFDISESGTWNKTINAAICPDESIESDDLIEINNNSEVDVKCEITIEKLTDNVPTIITSVQDKNDTSNSTTYTSRENNKYTFEKLLKPNDTAQYSLEINWDSSDKNTKYIGMVDCYKVTVIAKQVD